MSVCRLSDVYKTSLLYGNKGTKFFGKIHGPELKCEKLKQVNTLQDCERGSSNLSLD